jgi:hypothetical protein
MEGVLIEHEAQRTGDNRSVDRPMAEYLSKPTTETCGQELDAERYGAVIDTSRQCQSQRPCLRAQPGDGEAAGQDHREPGRQRQHGDQTDVRPAVGRPGDDDERRDAYRADNNGRK